MRTHTGESGIVRAAMVDIDIDIDTTQRCVMYVIDDIVVRVRERDEGDVVST